MSSYNAEVYQRGRCVRAARGYATQKHPPRRVGHEIGGVDVTHPAHETLYREQATSPGRTRMLERPLALSMLTIALGIVEATPRLEAQDVAGARPSIELRLGLKGGVNVSGIDHPEWATRSRAGTVVGILVDYAIGPVFGVRLEALSTRKGATVADRFRMREERIDYLEFPLLLAVRIPTGVALRPVVTAGPVLAHCSAEAPDAGCRDHAVSTDAGFALGGGFEVERGKLKLSYDGRYTRGLIDMDRTSLAKKHRVWSFTMALSYRLYEFVSRDTSRSRSRS